MKRCRRTILRRPFSSDKNRLAYQRLLLRIAVHVNCDTRSRSTSSITANCPCVSTIDQVPSWLSIGTRRARINARQDLQRLSMRLGSRLVNVLSNSDRGSSCLHFWQTAVGFSRIEDSSFGVTPGAVWAVPRHSRSIVLIIPKTSVIMWYFPLSIPILLRVASDIITSLIWRQDQQNERPDQRYRYSKTQEINRVMSMLNKKQRPQDSPHDVEKHHAE